MDQYETKFAERKSFGELEVAHGDDELVSQRLNWLLAENTKYKVAERMKAFDEDAGAARAMRHPLNLEKTFGYFGLILGIFPPAVFFIRFYLETNGSEPWLFGLFAIVNLLAAVIGYFSGKMIARVVRTLEQMSWPAMIALLPVAGLIWGTVTGAGAGVVVFGIGALFGGVIGGLVGAAAMPAFAIPHRLVKSGEYIEQTKFLSLAMGVTMIICAFLARPY